MVVGRYKKPGTAKVIVQRHGRRQGRRSSTSPPTLVEKSNDETFAFIEKLWAVRRVGEILDELDLKGKNDELVKELVDSGHAARHPHALHVVHGRRERQPPRHGGQHGRGRRASREAGRDVPAPPGWQQRAYKGAYSRRQGQSSSLREAYGAAMPAAPAPANAIAGGAAGGPIFGRGGGFGQAGPLARLVNRPPAMAEDDRKDESAQNVRHVGNRAFYRRDGQWIDTTVTEEQQKHAQAGEAVQQRILPTGPQARK